MRAHHIRNFSAANRDIWKGRNNIKVINTSGVTEKAWQRQDQYTIMRKKRASVASKTFFVSSPMKDQNFLMRGRIEERFPSFLHHLWHRIRMIFLHHLLPNPNHALDVAQMELRISFKCGNSLSDAAGGGDVPPLPLLTPKISTIK